MRTWGMGSPGCGGDSTARSVAAIVLTGIVGSAGRVGGAVLYCCTATDCSTDVGAAGEALATCGERQGDVACCGGLIGGALSGNGAADGIGALNDAWSTFEGGCV